MIEDAWDKLTEMTDVWSLLHSEQHGTKTATGCINAGNSWNIYVVFHIFIVEKIHYAYWERNSNVSNM
jgi:hypothetical protein